MYFFFLDICDKNDLRDQRVILYKLKYKKIDINIFRSRRASKTVDEFKNN